VFSGPESYITPALTALKTVNREDKTREKSKFLFDPSESDKVLLFKEYATKERVGDWLRADDNSG